MSLCSFFGIVSVCVHADVVDAGESPEFVEAINEYNKTLNLQIGI